MHGGHMDATYEARKRIEKNLLLKLDYWKTILSENTSSASIAFSSFALVVS